MTSAFKNFFITFTICLLVFAFLGWNQVLPAINTMLQPDETSNDTSDNGQNDTSESSDDSSVIVEDDFYDEDGDIFTAAILCVDSNDRVINCAFIDSNGKTKQYIRCTIPASTKTTNEVNVPVSVGDLLGRMSPEEICQAITAMTGIQTDYCFKFDKEGVKAIAEMIPNLSITLETSITVKRAEVFGDTSTDDTEGVIPADTVIPSGQVLLSTELDGRTYLDWLMEYTPYHNGEEYTRYYSAIAEEVFEQFFRQETALKSNSVIAAVINSCETNLTVDVASEYLEAMFAYDDFQYHDLNYPPSWETAVSDLREIDGRYNR